MRCRNCNRDFLGDGGSICPDCMRMYEQGHEDGRTTHIRNGRYAWPEIAAGSLTWDDKPARRAFLDALHTTEEAAFAEPLMRGYVASLVKQMDDETDWRNGGWAGPFEDDE